MDGSWKAGRKKTTPTHNQRTLMKLSTVDPNKLNGNPFLLSLNKDGTQGQRASSIAVDIHAWII